MPGMRPPGGVGMQGMMKPPGGVCARTCVRACSFVRTCTRAQVPEEYKYRKLHNFNLHFWSLVQKMSPKLKMWGAVPPPQAQWSMRPWDVPRSLGANEDLPNAGRPLSGPPRPRNNILRGPESVLPTAQLQGRETTKCHP